MKLFVFATMLVFLTFLFQTSAQPVNRDTVATDVAEKFVAMPAPSLSTRGLYMDVHHLGAGKVTAAALADAHKKDLAVEKKYGVTIRKYYFDEVNGDVYCLASAANAAAIRQTHADAHGLVPDQVYEVVTEKDAVKRGRNQLYLDVHELGAGNVNAKDVAAAHQRDLTVQKKHGVNLINYFLDVKKGTIICLAQAPNADSLIATHKEAHGLLPSIVTLVTEKH